MNNQFISLINSSTIKHNCQYFQNKQAIIEACALVIPTHTSADFSLKDAVAIVDDPRGVIGTALVTEGEDFNSTEEATINKALPLLEKLRPNITAFNTDSPEDLVVNGDAIASWQTGAQAVFGKLNNDSLVISYPKEAVSYGIDAFVIPKDAPNLENAYTFLNFLLNPEVAGLAVEWTHYMNATLGNEDYIKELIAADQVAIVPAELLEKGTLATDIDSAQEIYDKIWTEYK
jgi:spermidine/putrescine-binding protein